jgi:hypothetical protein
LYFLFSNNPYSLSSTSCGLTWTCENSKFKFGDNFGIKQRAPGPNFQNVLEVPAGTSNPNQSAKYKLEVPAGTSKQKRGAF